MEAGQPVQPTGTNRSNPLDPPPPACSGKRQAPRISGPISGSSPRGPRHPAPRRGHDPPRHVALARSHSQIPPGPPPKGTQPAPQRDATPPRGTRRFRGARAPRGPAPKGPAPKGPAPARGANSPDTRGPGQPGGHSEGPNTRSHPELGRENPQRRWYCASRRGRAGRRQALPAPTPGASPPPITPSHIANHANHTAAGWSSPVARQAHNLKVVGSNPTPATTSQGWGPTGVPKVPISRDPPAAPGRAKAP